MSDKITKSQIFNQITKLQNNLESLKDAMFQIQCVPDSQEYVESEDAEPILLEYPQEVAMEKLKTIRDIVLEREKTLNKMLDFYLKLYQNAEKCEKE